MVRYIIIAFFCIANTLYGKSYVIGGENLDYAPYYIGNDKEYKGFARELFDMFGKKKGYTFTYKPLPVKRLLSELLNGKIDFKFPDKIIWAQEVKQSWEKNNNKKIVYSDNVVKFIDGVMVKKENASKGIATLKILGIVLGFTPWEYLDDIKSNKIELFKVKNLKQVLNMTARGRNDGSYGSISVMKYQLGEMDLTGRLVWNKNLPYTADYYQCSSIRHPEVIAVFTRFLREDKAAVEKLKEKYGLQDKSFN